MKKILFLCVSAFLLTGCLSGRSPDSKFFLLEQGKDIEIVSDKKISLLVEPVVVPDLIYKPQIVLKKEESAQILISEFNRWAEPLPDVLRQTLMDDLQLYLPAAFIKPVLYTTDTPKYQYRLNVEVNHFIGTFDNVAVLDVWWSLKNASGKTIVRKKTHLETPIGDTYQDYVLAQSRLVSDLAKLIAESIK